MNFINEIKDLVCRNQIEIAIHYLHKLCSSNEHLNSVILLSAKRYNLEKQIRNGIISLNDSIMIRQQINAGILSICAELEEEQKEISFSKLEMEEAHYLNEFPRGPLVQISSIERKIITSFSELISDPGQIRMTINEAINLRKKADENAKVIGMHHLPSVEHTPPENFWNAVFSQAGLQGPRMLAALLLTVFSENYDSFKDNVKKSIQELLEKLKTHQ